MLIIRKNDFIQFIIFFLKNQIQLLYIDWKYSHDFIVIWISNNYFSSTFSKCLLINNLQGKSAFLVLKRELLYQFISLQDLKWLTKSITRTFDRIFWCFLTSAYNAIFMRKYKYKLF